MSRLECRQSNLHQHRLPFLSYHLSSVRYVASDSMKACTELRTILMLVMGISSGQENVTLLICQHMKQSNFFVKTSESYALCFVPMVGREANAHTTNAQNFLIVFIFVYVYYLSFWFERELMRYTKVPYFSLAEFFLMALLMALLVF